MPRGEGRLSAVPRTREVLDTVDHFNNKQQIQIALLMNFWTLIYHKQHIYVTEIYNFLKDLTKLWGKRKKKIQSKQLYIFSKEFFSPLLLPASGPPAKLSKGKSNIHIQAFTQQRRVCPSPRYKKMLELQAFVGYIRNRRLPLSLLKFFEYLHIQQETSV